jgi:hypothetical protein
LPAYQLLPLRWGQQFWTWPLKAYQNTTWHNPEDWHINMKYVPVSILPRSNFTSEYKAVPSLIFYLLLPELTLH